MRAQDKKRVEECWLRGSTAEQTANNLNLPLDEVQAIRRKLENRIVQGSVDAQLRIMKKN